MLYCFWLVFIVCLWFTLFVLVVGLLFNLIDYWWWCGIGFYFLVCWLILCLIYWLLWVCFACCVVLLILGFCGFWFKLFTVTWCLNVYLICLCLFGLWCVYFVFDFYFVLWVFGFGFGCFFCYVCLVLITWFEFCVDFLSFLLDCCYLDLFVVWVWLLILLYL